MATGYRHRHRPSIRPDYAINQYEAEMEAEVEMAAASTDAFSFQGARSLKAGVST